MAKPQKKEVQLDPGLQERLLQQMREEQAAAMRSRSLRRYVALPGTLIVIGASIVMALSDDMVDALVGNLIASSVLFYLWKIRKQIPRVYGLS